MFATIALMLGFQILHDDFRDHALVGDSSSYLLQAESLGFAGHNLSYDAKDLEYFRGFGWAPLPYGLHFQKYDDGWSFAKPYGYSAYLAPFIRTLGPRYGVSGANLSLLTILGGFGAATLRLRYQGAIVPIVLGTFLFASPLVFYAFHVWVEVYWAALVMATFYALMRAAGEGRPPWVLGGVALAAFLVSEKAPALPLVLPLVVVAVGRMPQWRARTAVVAAGLLVLLIACIPYLRYSDGSAWNAYGGDRFYARSNVPFDGDADGFSAVATNETFSTAFIKETMFEDLPDKASSSSYYVFGRHTGLLPFTPVALLVLIAALCNLRRIDPIGTAVLLGIVGYIAFYVILFPGNYNGGGQTLGNRYFLQAYPAVLALFVSLRMRARSIVVGSAVCAIVALAFMGQHYRRPSQGLQNIDKTNPIQRLLPFESNQSEANYFRCGSGVCPRDDE